MSITFLASSSPPSPQSLSYLNARLLLTERKTSFFHSDYATKVFGFATFGRIYGTVICVSGAGQFIQPALDALTHGPLHNNPVPINALFAVAGSVISVALTLFVYTQSQSPGERRRRRANHIRDNDNDNKNGGRTARKYLRGPRGYEEAEGTNEERRRLLREGEQERYGTS